jgi:glycosyltransferase involved in cell wall biosynthesis
MFVGAEYNQQALGHLFERHDVCVSPGNVGLTAIHAMSFGCPVATHSDVSRQMPEASAVIPGLTGTLFDFGKSDSLAQATWSFVTSSDPIATAHACRSEIASRWTPQGHAARIGAAIADAAP